MLFNSLSFLFWFLPITVLGYRLCRSKLFFYAWGEPVYILLILLSIFLNFQLGLWLERATYPRLVLIAGLIWNFGLLILFKYIGMATDALAALTGVPLLISVPSLPLGISFYTFQASSYLIDIYRKQSVAQTRLVDFGLYIALFARLASGPIVCYSEFAPQLTSRCTDYRSFSNGVQRFLLGLGKKVLLANNLGIIWEMAHSVPAGELSSGGAWVGLWAFTLQIYFDFSGYSDMALGIGRMFGFSLPENFQYPYLADSISSFWRRWHITLGQWFRNYLYIPLGGNRSGRIRLIRNLMIVWLLTGLWHGASWNFVLWGFYYGCLLAFEKLWFGRVLKCFPVVLRHFYTLLAVGIGWVLFACTSPEDILNFLKALFFQGGQVDVYLSGKILSYLFVGTLAATPILKQLVKKILAKFPCLETPLVTLLYSSITILSISGMVGATYQPFLYFRF